MTRLIDADALKKALKSNCDTLCNDKNTNWCEHCCPLNDFEDLIDNAPTVEPLDNKMTTLVTLSDGWDHVREAYYDKGRQLVFTEWFSVKDLDSRYININERKELSDSEVKENE